VVVSGFLLAHMSFLRSRNLDETEKPLRKRKEKKRKEKRRAEKSLICQMINYIGVHCSHSIEQTARSARAVAATLIYP
jgi:hypothetical protein